MQNLFYIPRNTTDKKIIANCVYSFTDEKMVRLKIISLQLKL